MNKELWEVISKEQDAIVEVIVSIMDTIFPSHLVSQLDREAMADAMKHLRAVHHQKLGMIQRDHEDTAS